RCLIDRYNWRGKSRIIQTDPGRLPFVNHIPDEIHQGLSLVQCHQRPNIQLLIDYDVGEAYNWIRVRPRLKDKADSTPVLKTRRQTAHVGAAHCRRDVSKRGPNVRRASLVLHIGNVDVVLERIRNFHVSDAVWSSQDIGGYSVILGAGERSSAYSAWPRLALRNEGPEGRLEEVSLENESCS